MMSKRVCRQILAFRSTVAVLCIAALARSALPASMVDSVIALREEYQNRSGRIEQKLFATD